ncbi:hypothetical protein NPIL_106121 [Nephila pilipes]|uniref:Uncharacterized protein n=1 Tax=Nephila pilipes TaxID=299642 RepID=A0A8X6QTW1_NEPPI|nr:hypothetical protein NPIL_106121 [Nephila pilipes]
MDQRGKDRIRATAQKRVGGGVNREQKNRGQRRMWKTNGLVSPSFLWKSCKPLGTSRQTVLALQRKEGGVKGEGSTPDGKAWSPENGDGPIGVCRREKGTQGEEGIKKNQDKTGGNEEGKKKQMT